MSEGLERPQKSWRTAWRKQVRETARRVGREAAAQRALESAKGLRGAISAWKRAAAPIRGLRFHDLCHKAITEMAEAGASDGTLMPSPATCPAGCWNTTATCAWPPSAQRWKN